MRTALALAALCAFAPAAGALSIRPPQGQIAPSPDGRFVFVYVAAWSGTQTDPDAAAIREKCRVSGMYRRGEWDAPLWELHPAAAWGRYFPADDGVHLAVHDGVHFAAATSFDFHDTNRADPNGPRRKKVLAVPAFTLYANGKLVRTVLVRETTGTADGACAHGVLQVAEFRADGLFHVTSGDGNRTVWDPATGECVEGTGAPPEPEALGLSRPEVLLPLGAIGSAVGALVVYRRVRRAPRAAS